MCLSTWGDHKKFADLSPPEPKTVVNSTISASPIVRRPMPKASADATPYILRPYVGLNICYVPRTKLSSYSPSSLMMDYLIHLVNGSLSDNFYFKRACPDYHPYIIRLYYGVLFWIQCLRAARDVHAIDDEQYQLLTRFLDYYPPESLTISSPLLELFKTLCSSQPEISTYGKVYPAVPSFPGPNARSDLMNTSANCYFVPNIPGIMGLLAHLNSLLNPADPAQATYPAKGKHILITSTATGPEMFALHTFPVPNERTDLEKWSLCSSGLQYPCEADKKLHENFAERISGFGFPTLHAADDLRFLSNFLSMDGGISWFAQVRSVAAMEASFFEGSGTLADCSPSGVVANQICVKYFCRYTIPTAPTHNADPAALFPFAIRLNTTARKLPELAEVMAATAQTHIRMFSLHPYFGTFGNHIDKGPFWAIRPVESSCKDEASYLSLKGIVWGLMKQKY